MKFKDSFRMEAVYFQKLKSDIDIAKSFMNAGNTAEARAILENAVDVDGAVLLLYRNLGELWAELAAKIEETKKALDALAEKTDQYHDELNKKIDEVNNYIMGLIRELDERLSLVEQDLATMNRVKFIDLVQDEQTEVYSFEYQGESIDYDAVTEMVDFPHLVIIREDTGSGIRYYYQDDADPYTWNAVKLAGETSVIEKTVSIANTDVVTVSTNIHQEFYIITASYDEPLPGDNFYKMYHNGTQITVDAIKAAVDAGKIPIFIYTADSVGKQEVYSFSRYEDYFYQFENIQNRLIDGEQKLFNGRFSCQGNAALFSMSSLGETYTAGDNISIEDNVISCTLEPCCNPVETEWGEPVYNEDIQGNPTQSTGYVPLYIRNVKNNKINIVDLTGLDTNQPALQDGFVYTWNTVQGSEFPRDYLIFGSSAPFFGIIDSYGIDLVPMFYSYLFPTMQNTVIHSEYITDSEMIIYFEIQVP